MSQSQPSRGATSPHAPARPPRRERYPDLTPSAWTDASHWPDWTDGFRLEADVDPTEWGPWADKVPFTIPAEALQQGPELPLFAARGDA